MVKNKLNLIYRGGEEIDLWTLDELSRIYLINLLIVIAV